MHITIPLFIPLLMLITACSSTGTGKIVKDSYNSVRESVNIDLSSQPEIIFDNWVNSSPVQVYVHPDVPPENPPKVLFIPFRMTQDIEHFMTIGRNISHMIWQNWLQNKVFSTLEFLQTTTPYRPELALDIAEKKGADLVVTGYITDFIDGGTTGDTRVSIAIEVYDVQTRNLLWSMAQAGSMQAAKVNDYLIFATKRRMPSNPSAAVINVLAEDMGKKVKEWITPTPPEKSWYKTEPSAF